MAKEITLAELSKKASTDPTIKKVNRTETIKGASEVSINDLSKNLPGKKQEETKQPPIIENAFSALDKTLAERKENIEKTMPYIIENAKEIALENEMKAEEASKGKTNIPEYDETETVSSVSETPSSMDDIDLGDDFKDLDEKEKPESEEVIPTVDVKETVKTSTVENVSPVNKVDLTINKSDNVSEDLDGLDTLLDDLDNEDDFTVNETDTEETAEEARERFKESLSVIKVSKDPIDLSSFKIRSNPISSSVLLNSISNNKYKKKCDWVLYNTGRTITLSECDGPELDALRKTMENSNAINTVIATLKLIYNHDEDPNKPKFETWAKHIRTEDIESLYFGLYKACYSDMNLLARNCPNPNAKNPKDRGCGKASIIDTNIMSMVKYENDEVKAKFEKIMQKESTTEDTTIKSKMIIASDDIAISYTLPTLYSTFIQFASLPDDVTNKYSDFLNSLAYINGFFKIDKANKELIPLESKVYPNNLNKTVRAKLKLYIDVLKTLNNDQYNILTSKLNNLIEDPKITYVYPETTCPECGKIIKEEPVESMLSLLFTRAQLAQIKSF